MYSSAIAPSFHRATVTMRPPPSNSPTTQVHSPDPRDCPILCVTGRDGWSVGGRDPVAVVDGQGVQDLLPGVDPPGRVRAVRPPLGGYQVEHLQGGLLVGEMASVTDGFAEPGVQALD